MHKFYLHSNEKKDHSSDPWYQSVTELMKGSLQSPDFIGHCCEIKATINKDKVKHISKSPDKNEGNLLYDSYLHITGIQVLISPSIKQHIDIHGLGRENHDQLPGLIHGVVNSENASTLFDNNLIYL